MQDSNNSEPLLGDLIRRVQLELIDSQQTRIGSGLAPLFEIEELQIEISFVIKKMKKAEGGIDIGLVAIGVGGSHSKDEIHKLSLKLKPVQQSDGDDRSPSIPGLRPSIVVDN